MRPKLSLLLLFPPAGKMSLSGWVCLVTGASRGIGRGIALQLSEAGATVYITGRQERTLKQTAAQVILNSMKFIYGKHVHIIYVQHSGFAQSVKTT